MSDQGAERLEDRQTSLDLSPPAGPGAWWSSPAAGAKVCALRLDTVHLVHSGLAPEGDLELVEEFFAEAPDEFRQEGAAGGGSPEAEGPSGTPEVLPRELDAWLEALRFGHEEMWPEARELGSTVCLTTEEALWVLTRGAHSVAIACEAGGREAAEVPAGSAGTRLWRLDPGAAWRVEVTLPGGLAALWSARWHPEPALVAPGEATGGEGELGASAAVAPDEVVETSAAGRPLSRLSWPWPSPRWLPAWPAALRPYRPHLVRGGLAVAALLSAGLLWSAIPKAPLADAWGRFADFCAGRYRVRVTTVPPGAGLRVDGHEAAAVTPAWLVLREGEHRVEASLGEYGSAQFTLNGKRGGRESMQAMLLGRLAIGCADTTVRLSVRLDGAPVGQVPVVLDSVPAGRRQLSFQGRDVRPWSEEVGVAVGRTTRVMARPEKVPDHGVVLARAYRVGTDGLKDLSGATVYLDGRWAGVTPARIKVERGLHTVRLTASGTSSPVQLLRVEGGQELYATAEFGRSPEPEVLQEVVGAPSVAKPPAVRARLASTMPIRIAEMRLHFRPPGGDFARVPMELRSGGAEAVAEASLPVSGLAAGTQVSYFVTVKSDEGEEFVGEMKTVKLVP